MKARFLLSALLAAQAGLLPLQAQIRDIPVIDAVTEAKRQGVNENTRLALSPAGRSNKRQAEASPDQAGASELYRGVIRKYTWYVGVGSPLSEEEASRLPYYFRLSMKNPQGHWQHLEALHRDTLTTRHNLSTYVLDKQYDRDGRNAEWRKRLQSVAQWIQIPGLDGNEMIEERAYDAEGNMMYSFLPVRNADGRVTGSYNDAWGMPADLREDTTTTYGSVVCITYDTAGRDSIVDFLDGQGLRKYNSNGVYQQRYIYDADDRLLMSTSHNVVGDYITDNWGNCGIRYTYDDENHTRLLTVVDRNLLPMRMPTGRADGTQTYISCEIRTDRWGRDEECLMKGIMGQADSTRSGLHRIVYRYDEEGNLQETLYYDLENQPMTEAQARKNN